MRTIDSYNIYEISTYSLGVLIIFFTFQRMGSDGLHFYLGETGVKRDTGSKGTVGGKIVDVNKTLKIFGMLCKSV